MKLYVLLLISCLEFNAYGVHGKENERNTKHLILPDVAPSPHRIRRAIDTLEEGAREFWIKANTPIDPIDHERRKRQTDKTARIPKKRLNKRRPDDTFCKTLVQFTPREGWRESLEYGYVYVIAGFTEAKCLTRQSRIVYGICKQEYQWIFLPVLNCEIFANRTIGECKPDHASIRYASGCTAHAVDVPFCGDEHSPLEQLGPAPDLSKPNVIKS